MLPPPPVGLAVAKIGGRMRATSWRCVGLFTLAVLGLLSRGAVGFQPTHLSPKVGCGTPARSQADQGRRLAARETASYADTRPRNGAPTSMRKQMSEQVRQMRADMEKDEKVALLMQSLRGQGLQDYTSAAAGVDMLIVETEEGVGDDRLPLSYQPDKLEAYFKKRPAAVRKRIVQVFTIGSKFLFDVALDIAFDKVQENDVKRAAQLRDIITSLGPFFIKLGQALSIRPDILSPRAMVELQKLCDKVPAFDSKLAMATIERELAKPVTELFSELTPEPVAAASLGQVYKGKLRATGELVAVKVQRPFVLETVSLDLYLMRKLGLQMRKVPFLAERTDLVALLDEFAFRFYQELDYNLECENGIRMAKHMQDIPQVVVPLPFPKYTSRRVHTAQWLEGEKLSQSTADDVQELVNVGVVAYLTQLLDTGFFHADPHPGNLIRTPDGKLAILDFGLMTDITDDQKYGMIEAISHLVHRDYSRIGQDFQTLGFIPEGTDLTPIVPALSKVFDAALAGGGAKSINFQDLSADLAEITFKYPFRIPPYFALIIRAIGVLEGIALVGNPGFAIVDEAYPYISKRLLTDDSPRLRAALRYMIYGKENVFDVDRLIDLLQAFETLEAVRATVPGAPQNLPAQQEANLAAGSVRDALRFFFSPDGQFFRDFLMDETVKGVDAVSREGVRELARTIGFQGPFVPPVFKALAPKLSAEDKRVVENTSKLLGFLLGGEGLFDGPQTAGVGQPVFGVGPLGRGALGGGRSLWTLSALNRENVRVARELLPVVRELGPQMRDFGLQIVQRLTERVASRFLRFARDQILGPEQPRLPTPSTIVVR